MSKKSKRRSHRKAIRKASRHALSEIAARQSDRLAAKQSQKIIESAGTTSSAKRASALLVTAPRTAGWLIGFVASLLALYELRAKVDIVKDPETLDASTPMGTQFTVKNNSFFPLKNVEARCFANEVRNREGGGVSGMAFDNSHNSIPHVLPSGEAGTLPCSIADLVMIDNIESADIVIMVDYDYLLFHRSRFSARFVTKPSADGHLKWFPQPLSQADAVSKQTFPR